MKKNEFFKKANLESANIRSWGASNEKFQVLCCWYEGVIQKGGKNYAEVFDLDNTLMQTQQRKERKIHLDKAKQSSKLTYILLGSGRDGNARSYQDISMKDKLVRGGEVITENNKHYIELTNDICLVESIV
ncbi:hypothetical protein [Photobacterium leiognathi]|uniref:hypothetical protein n=1 Tax=Photobacterium leiognathi TaxID=553611 RepID=UPI00298182C0|nr:hypothetical protein [Photobacterium leiognathi]